MRSQPIEQTGISLTRLPDINGTACFVVENLHANLAAKIDDASLALPCEQALITRLSDGGVADEWVTQLLRQGDSQVFKKYSQMKLKMKREALEKMNRLANEMTLGEAQPVPKAGSFGTVLAQSGPKCEGRILKLGEVL